MGQVDDHGGVAFAQQAYDVGGVGEAGLLPPGHVNAAQLAEPPVITLGVEHDNAVAELHKLLQNQPGQVRLALAGSAADSNVQLRGGQGHRFAAVVGRSHAGQEGSDS